MDKNPKNSASPVAALCNAIPGLIGLTIVCPDKACCNTYGQTITYLVIHLNDFHEWTREQIADWLETLDVDLSFFSPKEMIGSQ